MKYRISTLSKWRFLMPEGEGTGRKNEENHSSERVRQTKEHIRRLQGDLERIRLELEERNRALQTCNEEKTRLARGTQKLLIQIAKLTQYLEDLVALGEPPYSIAVFVSLSELDDGRQEEIKKFFGMPIEYHKCYLLVDQHGKYDVVVGSVSKSLGGGLESGQLVFVNNLFAVVNVVPDGEIRQLKAVSEGVVEKIAGDLIIVGDVRGFRGQGVVYSNNLKEELTQKPLEEGDKVFLFGPCILGVLERVSGKRQKVNIRRTTFADIGGLDKEIQQIRDVMGLDFDEEAKRAIKMDEAKGIVLHGPPGVGKTMLVRAIASELGYHFVLVNGADFESMWVGKSQEQLRARLDEALKNKPAIVFFDEVEAAFPVRGAAVGLEHKNDNLAAFNTFMDGVEDISGVFVIFGSNRIDKVDPAVIRSGRMSKKIYIPRPNREGAGKILKIYLPRHPVGEQGDAEEMIARWINRLLDEIYSVHKLAHLFTAFRGSEDRKYYFKDFISGGLLKGMVDEAVLRALKRMKDAGIKPGSPAFGVIGDDFSGVVSYMINQDIPHDDRSRNEWLMTNGYPRADEFRDGDAVLKFQEKERS